VGRTFPEKHRFCCLAEQPLQLVLVQPQIVSHQREATSDRSSVTTRKWMHLVRAVRAAHAALHAESAKFLHSELSCKTPLPVAHRATAPCTPLGIRSPTPPLTS
jgi:hypothetical protein